ncbi:hypothetical protein, partial [Alistipes putredinis]|uniref:hypothetical protein n=1 Tax=Alistipes putredinis TaxID=28117 RepID=UPI003AAE6F81
RVAPRCVLSGAGRLQVRYRVDFSDEPCYRRFFLTNERGIFVSLTSFWILRLGKMQIKFAFALGLFVSLPWKIFVWAASCSA